MPELPEVETVRTSLARLITGAKVRSVCINHPGVILHPSPAAWTPLLRGARLTETGRRGKFLFLRWQADGAAPEIAVDHGFTAALDRGLTLDRDPTLDCGLTLDRDPSRVVANRDHNFVQLVHLRMTGRLVVVAATAPVAKHTHVQIGLRDGRELRFVDPRRFGRMALVSLPLLGPLAREAGLTAPPSGSGSVADFAAARAALPPGLWQLGPEPLSSQFTRRYLANALQGRRAAIKALLLDQRLVAGLGNIYVDEALYRTGLHPRTLAGDIPRAVMAVLHRAIRAVLREGIAYGGTTLSDYRDATGTPGAMATRLLVFRRAGEPCHKCQTTIRKISVAGRGTHFCPRCQPTPAA